MQQKNKFNIYSESTVNYRKITTACFLLKRCNFLIAFKFITFIIEIPVFLLSIPVYCKHQIAVRLLKQSLDTCGLVQREFVGENNLVR